MLDLQPFCSTDETRWYLLKPFSMGEFSYATNGHIEIRQPRREDIPEMDEKAPKFDASAPFAGIESAVFSRIEADLPPPPETTGPCKLCDGRGYEHDCPSCDCVCEPCHGSGEMDPERFISTSIGGVFFVLSYVRQMLELPGVEISNTAVLSIKHKKSRPLLFRFDGGEGALMPRMKQLEDHIEIERVPA